MTSRECIRAAIEHRKTDRIPYFIQLTCETAERIKKQHGVDDVESWLDNDVLRINMPWWDWHNLDRSWKGMNVPTTRPRVRGIGNYDNLADNLKLLRDTCDKYFLVAIYGCHFEKACFARGFENFLADLAGEPSFAKELLDLVIEKNLVMLENFLSMPEIDGVLFGSDWGTQQGLLMSLRIWDELIRPGEQKMYDLAHSYDTNVWVHSCGQIYELIPRLIEMGVDVLNPIQPECMDIAKLKTEFGDEITFWGGISTQQTLPFCKRRSKSVPPGGRTESVPL